MVTETRRVITSGGLDEEEDEEDMWGDEVILCSVS